MVMQVHAFYNKQIRECRLYVAYCSHLANFLIILWSEDFGSNITNNNGTGAPASAASAAGEWLMTRGIKSEIGF